MADIKNKNELKRRIELFLDELDYSINEKFCKETMKMMREFIGHASHRLDCENSKIESLKKKLKEYKDLEEQGLLLRLPCKVGDTVFKLKRHNYCPAGICRKDISCSECRINTPFGIVEGKFMLKELKEIGKTVFLTKEEAEQKLKGVKLDE